MKNLFRTFFIFLLFESCKNTNSNNNIIQPVFDLEKAIIINNNESCVTYFKVKITNLNDKTIVFLDNSLKECFTNKSKKTGSGFYLKNKKNNSIIMLGIDNYYFYEIAPKSSFYCFIGAANLKNSLTENDSLLFRKNLSNYTLEYNGAKLDLNNIQKTKYISQQDYNNFIMNKHLFIPYREKIPISIPNKIKLKYTNLTPKLTKDWNDL